jgi:tRNA(Ile)-lysidine synthase
LQKKMLSRFEQKIAAFIKAKKLLRTQNKLLLAISGGADSTALLYVITSLKKHGVVDCDLICAHIHHQLRNTEADEDEQFIISKCGELSIPIETRRIDVPGYAAEKKISIETAARQLRISSLINIAKVHGHRYIATGHQMDDNAETILQRLARGTGYRGLGGIWPSREFQGGIRFIRPLLGVRRNEIVEYLTERQLTWQIDRSNRDIGFRRNFIRHRLIPELQKECTGKLVEHLSELSNHAQLLQLLVEENTHKVWSKTTQYNGNKVSLELEGFLKQPRAIQIELIRRSLKKLGSGEKYLTEGHYNRILQLARKKITGKKLELPGGFIAKRENQQLIFEQAQKKTKPKKINQSQEITIPGRTQFEDYFVEAQLLEGKDANIERLMVKKDEHVEWFDFQKLQLPLVIRFRQAGDRFWPLGLPGQKRVGKFLTSAKIQRQIREKLVIVSDSERIIWVWPARISEETKVSRETKNILQLCITYTKKTD